VSVARRTLRQVLGTEVDRTQPAVRLEHVTQTFRLFHEPPRGIKERLARPGRRRHTDLDALSDLSLTVAHGESLGVIGHNGSGKSTLLKLLARILPPDAGEVRTNGRVASLLELGAGFHGDLTGRENIYLNGAILGLSRAQVDERFDAIVEFAGVEQLLDTAVRTYSSGLYVRLGFAIAVAVEPDILLVDEVLAVGDEEFQERSLERMRRFRDEGKSIVLVSHDLEAVREMCDRVVVLEQGRKVFDGPVAEGIEVYRRRLAAVSPPVAPEPDVEPSPVTIEEVHLLDTAGADAVEVSPSSPLALRVVVSALQAVPVVSVGFRVEAADGTVLYATHTAWQGVGVGPLEVGERATVDLRFTAHLLAGAYQLAVVVTDTACRAVLAERAVAARFAIVAAPRGTGVVDLAAVAAVVEGPARRLDVDA
jgi:ABC-type polysaccharide/polyol phosphate transport system ATPase subunit